MIEKESKFQLTDRYGEKHNYRVTPLPAAQNIDLVLELAAVIAEPGMRLVKLAIDAKGIDSDASEVIAAVDFSALGADISSALRSLARNPKLVRRLLEGVIRDEKDMSTDAGFNDAYTANFPECIAVIQKVIEVNGFLDFLDSLQN